MIGSPCVLWSGGGGESALASNVCVWFPDSLLTFLRDEMSDYTHLTDLFGPLSFDRQESAWRPLDL
jgi:hypothetical protein